MFFEISLSRLQLALSFIRALKMRIAEGIPTSIWCSGSDDIRVRYCHFCDISAQTLTARQIFTFGDAWDISTDLSVRPPQAYEAPQKSIFLGFRVCHFFAFEHFYKKFSDSVFPFNSGSAWVILPNSADKLGRYGGLHECRVRAKYWHFHFIANFKYE